MKLTDLNQFTEQDVCDLNTISDYLSIRDFKTINNQYLMTQEKKEKIELIVLLGNADIKSVDIAVEAFLEFNADKLLISGGIGHSTGYLYENLKAVDKTYKQLKLCEKSEAELLSQLISKKKKIKFSDILIEKKSTNCGSNAYESLKLLREKRMSFTTVLLIQDATMQRRTFASFKREWISQNVKFYNYSIQKPEIIKIKNMVSFDRPVYPWDLKRYIKLVLGEIPRLKDDVNGYGPYGRDFIVHVDIPKSVESAYNRLCKTLPPSFFNR